MYRNLKLTKRILVLNMDIGNENNRQTDVRKNTLFERTEFTVFYLTSNYK